MKQNNSIRFKAAILLVVFSLNTIIGFACSFSLDKIFSNNNHHEEKVSNPEVLVHPAGNNNNIHQKEEAPKTKVHVHADGKKHLHQEKVDKNNEAAQSRSAASSNKQTNETDGNCCSVPVTKFEQLDKSITQSYKGLHPKFLISHLSVLNSVYILYTSYINTGIKYFVRSYHPPIQNIRVAIQSFQI
jgi:hypothetical protein